MEVGSGEVGRWGGGGRLKNERMNQGRLRRRWLGEEGEGGEGGKGRGRGGEMDEKEGRRGG